MNNLAIGTSLPNVVAPFNPLGKQAVGLENAAAKEEALPPVEESGESSRPLNRDDGARQEKSRTAEQRAAKEKVDAEAEQRRERRQQQIDQREISRLEARDREVRAHEQAHSAVGGQYAGAPSFQYTRGPDGVAYATAGEVPISLPTSSENPELTLRAAEQVRRAALAPVDPSPQDRQVAAAAANVAVQARAGIAAQSAEVREQARAERAEQREAQQANDARRDERKASNRRGVLLGEQLTALDDAENNRSAGAVLNQRA